MAQTDSDDATQATPPSLPPAWPGWLIATATCIRFYSRLPVPALPGEQNIHAAPDFRTIPRALPLAAVIIALPAAVLLLAAGLTGLASHATAGLALAALVIATGGLHEDGLADSADGLFGGQTPERRLEIMKDSRIGSYGALAIGLSLLLRASMLAAILDLAGAFPAAAALAIAAAWSRVEGLFLLAEEPAARKEGASVSVGRPSGATVWIAVALALIIALGLGALAGLPIAGLALGFAFGHAAALGIARLARRLIGGQTGDIVGAVQQCSEIGLYLGLAMVLGGGAA